MYYSIHVKLHREVTSLKGKFVSTGSDPHPHALFLIDQQPNQLSLVLIAAVNLGLAPYLKRKVNHWLDETLGLILGGDIDEEDFTLKSIFNIDFESCLNKSIPYMKNHLEAFGFLEDFTLRCYEWMPFYNAFGITENDAFLRLNQLIKNADITQNIILIKTTFIQQKDTIMGLLLERLINEKRALDPTYLTVRLDINTAFETSKILSDHRLINTALGRSLEIDLEMIAWDETHNLFMNHLLYPKLINLSDIIPILILVNENTSDSALKKLANKLNASLININMLSSNWL